MTDETVINDRSNFRLAMIFSEWAYRLLNEYDVDNNADEIFIQLFCEWFALAPEDIEYIKGLQS